MHRHRARQVVRDFCADAVLGGRELKRQCRQQALVQRLLWVRCSLTGRGRPTGRHVGIIHGMIRCTERNTGARSRARAFGLQLRQLLRQQLLGFEALPGRVAVVFQRAPAPHRAPGDAKIIAPRAILHEGCRPISFKYPRARYLTAQPAPGRPVPPCADTPAANRPPWGRPASARLARSPPADLNAGCIMVSPAKPPLISPRARMRLPTASAFCCDG